jgi:Protein of unknown function (DUF1207)
MYPSYVAGEKEPRAGMQWLHDNDLGWRAEATLGTRIPLWRYGTDDPIAPEGWQMDFEGVVASRVDGRMDLDSIDFKIAFLLTHRRGRTAFKAGFYHLSSHVADDFLLKNPGYLARAYARNSVVGGIAQDLTQEVRVYGEFGYAVDTHGGAEPVEVQFGAEYDPEPAGRWWGRPFAGVNLHFREEFGSDASINLVGGLQWRTRESRHTFRWGVQYYNGKSLQYSFFDREEAWLGTGVWTDF